MSDVKISYTIGVVSLVRDGKKRAAEAIPFKKSVTLQDGDKIITGAASYVVDLSDKPGHTQTGTMITIFPNSELILRIKGLIKKVELVNGLFNIATEKEVITPTAELRFPQGMAVFWIDVGKDGAVVVASESSPMEVVHKKTKRGVVINYKQQVTATQEDILGPSAIDQRFKEAYKLKETLEQSKAKFLYGDMLERNAAQEYQKFAKVIEEKTGRKEEYDPAKYQKWLKEQKELGERKYDDAVDSNLPEFNPVKAGEKPIPAAKPKIVDINKTANYQGIDFKIVSAEKRMELKGRNAPEGKVFLLFNVEVKNNSNKQVIIFYEEEVRLINESGGNIPLENYKMENNFDVKSEVTGTLLFLVARADKKFKLQFGKKSMPKTEIEFEIAADSL